ncbi:hypothetical protein TNCV_2321111 [Trichonephila clavipes]|nr:hypothetical protein TNCV_2321111 [Trichonephila clavipes]
MEKTLHSASKRAFSTNGEARRRWSYGVGCMASNGVGKLKYIESIMNKHDYLDVLRKILRKGPPNLALDRHFASNMTTILSSPDLNPIEHLYGICFSDDNGGPQTATAMKNHIEILGWDRLYHPPYSPNLAPSDFHIFLALKKNLCKQR